MFEQKSLDRIDGDYFNIIIADSQDVTIQSRNTGHYWYLHCAGLTLNGVSTDVVTSWLEDGHLNLIDVVDITEGF